MGVLFTNINSRNALKKLRILLKYKAKFSPTDLVTIPFIPCLKRIISFEAVDDILKSLKDLNLHVWSFKNAQGHTPLMLSSLDKSTSLFEALLHVDRRNVNAKDQEGLTVLMHVIQTSKIDIKEKEQRITLLLNNKASINSQDVQGRTALMRVFESNSTPIIQEERAQLLLNNKASTNIRDNLGRTALMYALKKEQTYDRKKLLKICTFLKNIMLILTLKTIWVIHTKVILETCPLQLGASLMKDIAQEIIFLKLTEWHQRRIQRCIGIYGL